MNPNTLVWQHVIHACFGNVGNQTFLERLPVVGSNTTFPQRIENVMNTFTQRCVATKPLYNQTKTLWKRFLLAGHYPEWKGLIENGGTFSNSPVFTC